MTHGDARRVTLATPAPCAPARINPSQGLLERVRAPHSEPPPSPHPASAAQSPTAGQSAGGTRGGSTSNRAGVHAHGAEALASSPTASVSAPVTSVSVTVGTLRGEKEREGVRASAGLPGDTNRVWTLQTRPRPGAMTSASGAPQEARKGAGVTGTAPSNRPQSARARLVSSPREAGGRRGPRMGLILRAQHQSELLGTGFTQVRPSVERLALSHFLAAMLYLALCWSQRCLSHTSRRGVRPLVPCVCQPPIRGSLGLAPCLAAPLHRTQD
jgi:hypothetical protein